MMYLRKIAAFIYLIIFSPICIIGLPIYIFLYSLSVSIAWANKMYFRVHKWLKGKPKFKGPKTYAEMDKYLLMATAAIEQLAKEEEENPKIYDFAAFKILGILIPKPKE